MSLPVEATWMRNALQVVGGICRLQERVVGDVLIVDSGGSERARLLFLRQQKCTGV